jgi:hypothetical protein
MAHNIQLNMDAWTHFLSRENRSIKNRSRESSPTKEYRTKRESSPTTSKPREAIVFIVAHSKYDSNDLEVANVLHSTLLVGGMDETCYTRRDTELMKMRIHYHFKDSIDVSLDELLDKANTMKNIIHPRRHTTNESRRKFSNFKKRSGIFSQPSYQYYEREWSFFENGNKDGFFIHIMMKKDGKIKFVDLYKDEIQRTPFVLSKTELLSNLSENFNLKNVVLVDFACTKFGKSLSKKVKKHLLEGEFLGGKTRKNRVVKSHRYSRHRKQRRFL